METRNVYSRALFFVGQCNYYEVLFILRMTYTDPHKKKIRNKGPILKFSQLYRLKWLCKCVICFHKKKTSDVLQDFLNFVLSWITKDLSFFKPQSMLFLHLENENLSCQEKSVTSAAVVSEKKQCCWSYVG